MINEICGAIWDANFAAAILRVSTPILLAALGAVISDRAGCINIGLEGIMLICALTGVVVSAATHNAGFGAYIGLCAAVVVGGLVGAVMAYMILNLKADTILTGVAVNTIGSGGTAFYLYVFTGERSVSSSLKSFVLPNINIPIIKDIPVIGSIISGQNLLTYISFILVFVLWFLLYKTPLGLRIRAVGENPQAADSVGINVTKMKYIALILSGIMAGLGGANMSMGYVSWFAKDMTAGRGFIALAAEAMGRGTPIGTLVSSLFFGFTMAMANSLQTLSIPFELVAATPYFATIVAIGIYSYRQKKKRR